MPGNTQSDIYTKSHSATEALLSIAGIIPLIGKYLDKAFNLRPQVGDLSWAGLGVGASTALITAYGASQCQWAIDKVNEPITYSIDPTPLLNENQNSESSESADLTFKNKLAITAGFISNVGGFTGTTLSTIESLWPTLPLSAKLVTQFSAMGLASLSAYGQARSAKNSMVKLKNRNNSRLAENEPEVQEHPHDIYTKSHAATETVETFLGIIFWLGTNIDDIAGLSADVGGLSKYAISASLLFALFAAYGASQCHSAIDRVNTTTQDHISENNANTSLTLKNKLAVAGGIISDVGGFTGTTLATVKNLWSTTPTWANLITQFSAIGLSALSATAEARNAITSMKILNQSQTNRVGTDLEVPLLDEVRLDPMNSGP